jgi:hypothetical protein
MEAAKDLKGAQVSFLNYILRILFIAKQPPGQIVGGSPSAFHLPLTPSIEPQLIACAS